MRLRYQNIKILDSFVGHDSMGGKRIIDIGKNLVDRRKDPNYEQVTGHVQKDLARRFKVFCTEQRITIAEALDKAIALFLEQGDRLAKNPDQLKNQSETFAELVRNNYFDLMNSDKINPDRLKDLAFGQKPKTAELVILANVLELPEELVVDLRDRSFPKNQSRPKQTNGHT
jgi:hypothetical protein